MYVMSRNMKHVRVIHLKIFRFEGEIFYIFESASFRNVLNFPIACKVLKKHVS